MILKKKLKIYIYPNARSHVQDSMEKEYYNVVPLSEKGIEDHCELVGPNEAEYYYMGQVSCGLPLPKKNEFKYFDGNKEKHIIDFEGDWFQKSIPNWLRNSIVSVSGVKKEYEGIKIFTRPATSSLLLDIIRNNRQVKHTFESNKNFCFKGFPDPRGIRMKMAKGCQLAGIKSNIVFNQAWQGKAHSRSKEVADYCKLMLQNTFALCPSGTGVDSVRFFEACFFSRIPVVVSDSFTMGHKHNKNKPFYFQIDPYNSIDEMARNLAEIEKIPLHKLKEMSYNSKEFFESKMRKYFEDPTLRFIEWLEENEK